MEEKLIEERSHRFRGPLEVAPDVACLQILMVNVYFVGEPQAFDGSWVLIDAGLSGSARRIGQAAEERFGKGTKPAAILLTHGHFDHVGALRELATLWDVPVYAHELEMPYLTGRSDYPPPDPTVGGGAVALMSRFFPRAGIDLSARVRTLPSDGTVPGMPGWRWIHTPGHTPGHTSFHLINDRNILFTGDTLFAESIGRTDLWGGSQPEIISSIQKKLMTFNDDTLVIPGHGEATTIGHERRYNPFLL